MTAPPDDQVMADLIPLLRAAARQGGWLHFATDRDEEMPAAARWLLTDSASPISSEAAHGRRPAIEWLTPTGWTTGIRQPPVCGTNGRVGRIRLRTPRPTARKEKTP